MKCIYSKCKHGSSSVGTRGAGGNYFYTMILVPLATLPCIDLVSTLDPCAMSVEARVTITGVSGTRYNTHIEQSDS